MDGNRQEGLRQDTTRPIAHSPQKMMGQRHTVTQAAMKLELREQMSRRPVVFQRGEGRIERRRMTLARRAKAGRGDRHRAARTGHRDAWQLARAGRAQVIRPRRGIAQQASTGQ